MEVQAFQSAQEGCVRAQAVWGTMGGGVWEGCMPPCAAMNAMSCADWSPKEGTPPLSRVHTC